MDGAADRVDLRGLGLLARCRTLRRDEAERARAEARRAVDDATTEAREAAERLDAHRSAWRDTEAASFAAMTGHTLDGARFRRTRDTLDAMADRAIRLQDACRAAQESLEAARRTADAARLRFTAEQRRLEQSNTIRDKVTEARAAFASALEEQELDDDLSQRFGRRG